MKRKRQSSRTNRRPIATDPLEVMRRACRLHEAIASREQARGTEANLQVMASAMEKAAQMAAQILAAEDRRGIAPVEPLPKVTIEIVEGSDGPLVPHCRRCGWKPGDDTLSTPMPPSPPEIDGEVIKPPPPAQKALPPPHPNDLPRRDPGSIHNARLPDGTPARMRRTDYSDIAPIDGGYSMTNAGPAPDVGRGHPLPSQWDVLPR